MPQHISPAAGEGQHARRGVRVIPFSVRRQSYFVFIVGYLSIVLVGLSYVMRYSEPCGHSGFTPPGVWAAPMPPLPRCSRNAMARRGGRSPERSEGSSRSTGRSALVGHAGGRGCKGPGGPRRPPGPCPRRRPKRQRSGNPWSILRLKLSLNGEVNSPCNNFTVRIFRENPHSTLRYFQYQNALARCPRQTERPAPVV